MSAPQKFRSAFNGFNRDDVVHYLEYLNSKHAAQVSQLTSEADFLRAKLETTKPVSGEVDLIATLQRERDELREQVAALQARCAELEQNGAAAPAPVCNAAEELEAYRRAERTERVARERAELIYHQASATLREASDQVDALTSQINPMADQVLNQLNQLQAMVASGKQSLQNAAQILQSLHPENK